MNSAQDNEEESVDTSQKAWTGNSSGEDFQGLVSADELHSSDFDNGTDSDDDHTNQPSSAEVYAEDGNDPGSRDGHSPVLSKHPRSAPHRERSAPAHGAPVELWDATGSPARKLSRTEADHAAADRGAEEHRGGNDDEREGETDPQALGGAAKGEVQARGVSCQLQLRLPGGEAWLLQLGGENTLREVCALASARIQSPCTLSKPYPRKVVEDLTQTLEEAGR
jgi:UBX domain